MAELNIRLDVRNRWWFEAARIITIVLIWCGIVRDTEKAAEWLARNGVRYIVRPD